MNIHSLRDRVSEIIDAKGLECCPEADVATNRIGAPIMVGIGGKRFTLKDWATGGVNVASVKRAISNVCKSSRAARVR